MLKRQIKIKKNSVCKINRIFCYAFTAVLLNYTTAPQWKHEKNRPILHNQKISYNKLIPKMGNFYRRDERGKLFKSQVSDSRTEVSFFETANVRVNFV